MSHLENGALRIAVSALGPFHASNSALLYTMSYEYNTMFIELTSGTWNSTPLYNDAMLARSMQFHRSMGGIYGISVAAHTYKYKHT